MTKRIFWHLEVTSSLNKKLETYISIDSFTTKSEFIRAAVRDRLEHEHRKLEDQP